MDLAGQTKCTMSASPRGAQSTQRRGPERARRTFLRFFPGGFQDETYISWERDYKWRAHLRWVELLDVATMRALMKEGAYEELARRAVAIDSRTTRPPYVPQAERDAPRGQCLRFRVCLSPRDMIDLQSFIWVQGSDEYH